MALNPALILLQGTIGSGGIKPINKPLLCFSVVIFFLCATSCAEEFYWYFSPGLQKSFGFHGNVYFGPTVSVGVLRGKVAGGLAMGLLGRTPLLYFQLQAMHFVEFPLAIGGGGGVCVFAKQGTGALHYKACPIAGLFAGSLLFAQYQMVFDNDTKSLYGFTLKLPIPVGQNWKDDWWIGTGGG